jgi:hypothetical protein
MKRLLAGMTSAIISFAVTRKLQRKETKSAKSAKHTDLVWISADDVEEESDGPKFNVGDEVITHNPYTSDYAAMDFDGSPLYFLIEDFSWDLDDGCYRYKMKHNDEWFAETWLMAPEYPYMAKPPSEETKEESEMKVELTGKAKERNIQLQIDYWLATLQDAKTSGDTKAYEEATKALEELTAK